MLAAAGPTPAAPPGQQPVPQPGGDDWQRLSPRSLAVRPVTDLIRLLPFLLGVLYLHGRGGHGSYLGLGFAAFAIAASVVRWLTTRYRITAERVYLRRGLLNQKVLSVARDRVRTVDLSAHLLYRMLGLRRVAIGTGRNDRREGESFRLDALTLADAQALRALLLTAVAPPAVTAQPVTAQPVTARPVATQPVAAKQVGAQAVAASAAAASPAPAATTGGGEGAAVQARPLAGIPPVPLLPGQVSSPVAASQAAAMAGEVELARLHLAWIRFAPLTLTGLVILGVLFGFAVQFNDAAHVGASAAGAVHRLSVTVGSRPAGLRIGIGAAAVLVAMVLLSTAGYVALFWGFRLVRQQDGALRTRRGLLSTRETTIDSTRLRGVELSEPLALRCAGGARCIAITTGLRVGRGAEHGGSLLLPPAPRATALAVAADVLGVALQPRLAAALAADPLVPHGRLAMRRRYTRALTAAALVVAALTAGGLDAGWPAWSWLSSLALLPLAALLAADRYRGLGHRLAGGRLVTCTGSLVRRRSVLATEGIIGWRIHQSWFQRRQGLVTLTATTAAGRQRYEVRDIPHALALSVASTATPDLVRPFLRQ
ncbi:MAG TPA: PH domain-containing protein [Streptosporangiaceae bacterium]